ncbi:uncharacterized protein JN550_005512 [Neoarthrinium moseri]|uniref:uncharacterized protein n=1 Tax=Neoarthrinium moseri TaxID=1658444 RepID=UPI001FDB227D|nr:uncharacterized protein JN550_005512 [Neoarthrinium moseri]KAI1869922.1 hypothetical protein JN550_005512 [Neoarthrinium moseri]
MDEAQTDVGRTDKMFAFEDDDIVPDILCLSKTPRCSLPLGSVRTTAEIAHGLSESKFLWLTTHLNDPLTAAVGDKVFEIVERDNIAHRAAERGEHLRAGLVKLQDKGSLHWRPPRADLGQLISNEARVLGLSCNVVNLPVIGDVFRLAPPVTVTANVIDVGLSILDEAFASIPARSLVNHRIE